MRSSNPAPTGGGGGSSSGEEGGGGSGVWGAVGGAVGGLFGKLFSPPAGGGENSEHQRVHDLTDTMSQSSYNSRGSESLANISSQMPPPPPPPPRSPPVAPPPTDKYLRRTRSRGSSGGGMSGGRGGTGARGGGGRGAVGANITLSQPPLDVQLAMRGRGTGGLGTSGAGGAEVPEDVRKALEARKRQEEEKESRAYSDEGGGVRDVRSRYVDVFADQNGGGGGGGV